MTKSADLRADGPVLEHLSRLDRFLPVWIIAAMATGLILGQACGVKPGAGFV